MGPPQNKFTHHHHFFSHMTSDVPGSSPGFNPYIEMLLIDIPRSQIMRSKGIINIILYYTWDITVFAPLTEFEYGL